MEKLTLAEWEKKYITGHIDQFDQKNTMFRRVTWDTDIIGLLDDWSFSGEVKRKPGYTLKDQALRWGCRRGTDMGLFNTNKPNPSPQSLEIAKIIGPRRPSGRSGIYQHPEGERIDVSDTEQVTHEIKKVASFFGADIVGVCELDRRWLYSHSHFNGSDGLIYKPQEIPEEYKYAIVMGFEEDYTLLKYFPTYIADAATSMGYSRMAITNAYLSTFIKHIGFKVIDCTTNDVALSIPMAMQAGLGDIGRNGLLITPQFGPRLRISKVITSMPLIPDTPIDFGVTEFCDACGKCADYCPSQAIIHGDRIDTAHNISNAGNELKWPINAERCRYQWGRASKPCTNCISVCPFNKDMRGWFHRLVSWCVDHARWADPLYVKMDDWFGYGKPKKADNFWEEWA